MKKKLHLTALLLLIFIISGCRGTFAPPSAGEEQPETAPQKTKGKYAPLSQSEDFVIVPHAVSFEAVVDSTQNPAVENPLAAVTGDSSFLVGDKVYRIQLFTAKEYGPAIREKNIAIEVFDQPVMMDYEVPYYKIRVGNFATRDEAEEYLPAARESGYKTAWVVRAYVNVKTVEAIYDGYDEEIFRPFDSTENSDIDNYENQDRNEYPED